MSTPLDVAVDIAGSLIRTRDGALPLHIPSLAREISGRHSDSGYSKDDIAAALIEESRSAGLLRTSLVDQR